MGGVSENLVALDHVKWRMPHTLKTRQLYRRPLRFAESLRLSNEVANLLGQDLAYGLVEVMRSGDTSDLAQADLVAALARSAGDIVGQIAGEDWDAWQKRVFGQGQDAVLYSAPIDKDDHRTPVFIDKTPDGDGRDVVFADAPLEAMAALAALIVEGIGPLPKLGSSTAKG